MGGMILGIDHLNIVVADMARSLAFYCDVLGCEKTKEAHLEGEWIEKIVGLRGVKAHAVFVELPGGGPRIELLHYHSPEGVAVPENGKANTRGLRHFCGDREVAGRGHRRVGRADGGAGWRGEIRHRRGWEDLGLLPRPRRGHRGVGGVSVRVMAR